MKAEYLLDCLEKDEIKVCLPSDCNDPFECIPQGMKTQPDNVDGMGFICLSEGCTSSTMWAHYADKHKGCCIELSLPISDPNAYWEQKHVEGKGNRMQAAVLKMADSENRKQFAVKAEDGICLDVPLLMKVGYYPYRAYHTEKTVHYKKNGKLRQLPCSRMLAAKGQEWAYEKEWRLFVSLDNCLSYHDGRYFVKGLTKYISKVMLGWKCKLPSPIIQRALNEAKTILPATCVRMDVDGNLFAVREANQPESKVPRTWRVDLEFSDEQWKALQSFLDAQPDADALKRDGYHQAVFHFLKHRCNLPDDTGKNPK